MLQYRSFDSNSCVSIHPFRDCCSLYNWSVVFSKLAILKSETSDINLITD